ncbi:MAG: hypothetical protein SFY70_10925 [Bacteroidia bacterium]|nr:hypothetical protein [Bacteroidia bacterium]
MGPRHLLTNVWVVDAASPWYDQRVDVRYDGAAVLEVGPAGTLSPEGPTTDGNGEGLTTGFVDLGAECPEPGNPHRGTLAEFALEAYLGGFADVLVEPQTSPALDTPEAVAYLKAAAAAYPVRLHPLGALTAHLGGELLAEVARLQAAGALALGDGRLPTLKTGLLERALHYTTPLDLPVFQPLALQRTWPAGVAHESPTTVALGLPTSPAGQEADALARAVAALNYAGGRLHVGPVTTADALAALKAAQQAGFALTAHTSPLYLMLTDAELASFDARYHLCPPLRSQADAVALAQAFADGTFVGIATHHTPVCTEEKVADFSAARPGGPVLHAAFAALNTVVVGSGLLTLPELVQRLTAPARQLLGLPTPVFEVGYTGPLFRLSTTEAYVPYRPKPVYAHADPFGELALVGRVTPLRPFTQP